MYAKLNWPKFILWLLILILFNFLLGQFIFKFIGVQENIWSLTLWITYCFLSGFFLGRIVKLITGADFTVIVKRTRY